MTQFQFDLICKIICTGAPALAEELCGALETFVQNYEQLVAENMQLKAQFNSESTAVDTADTAE